MRAVAAGADDVHQVGRSATSTLVENSRITCAAAVISPIVSFFTRRPISSAPSSAADISPPMMRRISASISSWKISRCSMTRVSASSVLVIVISVSSEEESAHLGDRAVDARGIDVQVRDQAQRIGPGGEDARRARCAGSSGPAVVDGDPDHVRLRRLDVQPGDAGQPSATGAPAHGRRPAARR